MLDNLCFASRVFLELDRAMKPMVSAATDTGHRSSEIVEAKPSPGVILGVPAPDRTQRIASTKRGAIVVIEPKALVRDCFVRSLGDFGHSEIIGFSSVEDFSASGFGDPVALMVLVSLECSKSTKWKADLRSLLSSGCIAFPVMVAGDRSNIELVVEVISSGANGYIQADTPLEVAVAAMRVVMAGGRFVPASCIISKNNKQAVPGLSNGTSIRPDKRAVPKGLFTARQAAVVDAITRGKANKAIAFELNMQESTVKVHVRNIMKKLNAKNRTEVAFLANRLSRE